MKKIASLLLLLLFPLPGPDAANVRLEQLADFDLQTHKINVNVQLEVPGGCLVNSVAIEKEFEGLLTVFGFQTSAHNESQLEFAVHIKGLGTSEQQLCGVMMLSMARQIPDRKILRISPGSNSRLYRLWELENVITAKPLKLQSLLLNQARHDVTDFYRVFEQSRHRVDAKASGGKPVD